MKPELKQNFDDIDDIEEPIAEEHIEDDFLSHNVKCDICNVFPICGARYKCVICKDYNLCEKC